MSPCWPHREKRTRPGTEGRELLRQCGAQWSQIRAPIHSGQRAEARAGPTVKSVPDLGIEPIGCGDPYSLLVADAARDNPKLAGGV